MAVGEPRAGDSLTGRKIGDYRIGIQIGEGGMGEVYRAHDERLDRTVAVKALSRLRHSDEMARARFLRETRLACKVSHPYVATVLNVVEESSELFLVMEYIDGRRLDKVIAVDHPGPRQLARYAAEVAQALSAIHAAGLVHRDLKPGNVMITPDGHVKVLDFGVARSIGDPTQVTSDPATVPTAEATLTADGAVVGTPLYMSPEQIRGSGADRRSDLFALGVLLYEAITEHHPFERPTPHEAVAAILNESPGGDGEEPQTLTQAGPLKGIVLRLLEKDPGNRYQTAEELASDLNAFIEGKAVRPKRRLHPAWVLAPVVAVLALVGVLWWLAPSPVDDSGRDVIAVLPFTDDTGDSVDRQRGESMAALLGADLSESGRVRSLGHERLMEILATFPDSSQSDRLEAVSEAAPVDWIVTNRLYREGDAYEAVVDIYRAGAGVPFRSFRVAAARTAGLVDLASVELRKALFDDYRPDEEEDPKVSEIASVSEEARLLAYRARQAAREYRYLEAIDLLEQALQIDPQFVAAHALLAETLDSAGYGARARQQAETALRLVEGHGATTTERIALETKAVHAKVHEAFETELEIEQELAGRYGDEPDTLLALASALNRLGRHDEALVQVERALAFDDRDPRLHLLRARTLRLLDRYEAATEALRETERLTASTAGEIGLAMAAQERGILLATQGEFDAAREEYQRAATGFRANGLPVMEAAAEGREADMLISQAEYIAARAVLERILPRLRAAGNLRLVVDSQNSLGAALYGRGAEFDVAERLLRDAVQQARELEHPRLLLLPLTNLTSLLIFSSRVGEGRRSAEEALTVARSLGERETEEVLLILLADLDYQRGALDDAADAYRDVIELAQSPDVDSKNLVWALTGLAEVLQAMGQLGEALESCDQAVDLLNETYSRKRKGYVRVRRAAVLTELAHWKKADDDLAAVSGLVGDDRDALEDLLAREHLVRGALAVHQGRWAEAERHAELALSSGGEGGPQITVPALVLLAESTLGRGQAQRAVSTARSAVEVEGSTVSGTTRARAVLARALIGLGQYEDAAREALHALDRAEGMGASFPAADAAAALLSLPEPYRPSDGDSIRDRGRRALQRYLDTVPTKDRSRMYSRRDVSGLMRDLGLDPLADG